MKEGKEKSYSEDFKTQILQECFETNNYSAVCRKYELPVTTVCGWIKKYKNRDNIKKKKTIKGLEKKLFS